MFINYKFEYSLVLLDLQSNLFLELFGTQKIKLQDAIKHYTSATNWVNYINNKR